MNPLSGRQSPIFEILSVFVRRDFYIFEISCSRSIIYVGMAVALSGSSENSPIKDGHFDGLLCFTWMSHQFENFQRKRLGTQNIAYIWKSFLQNIFVAEREAAQKDGGDGAGDGDSSEEASETTELVPAERDEEVSSDEEGDEEQYWKKVQKKGKMTTFKAFSKEKYFSAIK